MKNFEKLLKTDISDIFFGPISITDIGKRTDITDIDIYIGKPIPKHTNNHIYLASGNRTRARTWKILTFTQHRFGEAYRGAVHAACQHGCQFRPLFSGLFDETGCLSPIPVLTGYQYLRLTRGVSTGIRSTIYFIYFIFFILFFRD